MTTNIEEIIENFAYLDEWDDRYRYLIELGKSLDTLPESARIEANRVMGEHLTPQRSNGVRSMIERIKRDASAAELSNPITQPS